MARLEISEGTDLTQISKSDILAWLKIHDEYTTEYWDEVNRYFSKLNLHKVFASAIIGQEWQEGLF